MIENRSYGVYYLWNERNISNAPEILLWRYTIASGIKGALKGSRTQMFKDWEWFFGPQDYWNCFEHICEITGRSSERIRRGIVNEFFRRMRHVEGKYFLPYRVDVFKMYEPVFKKYLRRDL